MTAKDHRTGTSHTAGVPGVSAASAVGAGDELDREDAFGHEVPEPADSALVVEPLDADDDFV